MDLDQGSTKKSKKKLVIGGLIGVIAIVVVVLGAQALSKKDTTNTSSSASDNATSSVKSSASSSVNPTTTPSPSTDTTASSAPAPTATPTSSGASQSSSSSASAYKDGTYSATGSYSTPEGKESIDVTLTISGDTVTDASINLTAQHRESVEYQQKFASGYKSQVVGKKVSTIRLSRVSGASLTPKGFNEALDDIKQQAES